MATINISLPDPLYKEVKKLVARGGYTSISELIRDALRKKLDGSKITVNGFTEEIEKEVLWSEAGPDVSDVWKSEKDIRNYFKNLRAKRAKQKKAPTSFKTV